MRDEARAHALERCRQRGIVSFLLFVASKGNAQQIPPRCARRDDRVEPPCWSEESRRAWSAIDRPRYAAASLTCS